MSKRAVPDSSGKPPEPLKSVLTKDTDLKFPHLLLIDASAGSGKTHTLTQRYVQFLLSDNIPHNGLANILAITFTNNAAREMKMRILDWLKKLALGIDCEERKQSLELLDMSEAGLSARAGEALEKILDDYSDFHVQTIDSFMLRVMRASAWELGLPPNVDVRFSQDAFIELALEQMLTDVIEGDEEETGLTAKMVEFLYLLNEDHRKSYQWDPLSDIRKKFREFLKEELKNMGEIVFVDASDEIDRCYDRVKGVFEAIDRHKELFPWHSGKNFPKMFTDGKTDHEKLIASCAVKLPVYVKNRAANPGLYERLEAEWNSLAEIIPDYIECVSVSKFSPYGPVYKSFRGYLDQVKANAGTVGIGDINKKLSEFMNREGVQIVPEIYYSLGDTLSHFLMDEFQDTSKVQWGNINPLVGESLSRGGTFFAVGDLKQAIFRFNKADYRIMRDLKESIETRDAGEEMVGITLPNASVLRLKTNFRSGGIILEYVDKVFKNKLASSPEVLPDDLTGLTKYEQAPEEKRKAVGRVRVRKVAYSADGEGVGEHARKSALLEAVEDALKRYRPGEIGILTWLNFDVERVVSWLTEKGHPCASYSSLDIKKRKTIMELLSFLKFLDSPVDNLSFATFISGGVFRRAAERVFSARNAGVEHITGEDISKFIMKNRHGTGRGHPDYLYKAFSADARLGKYWELLFAELVKKVEFCPMYDIVSLAFRTLSVFENFPEETGSLVRFLESVSAMEKSGKNNIKDFVDCVLGDVDEDEGSMDITLSGFADSIRVMTFHKAKGLGFPVTINILRPFGGPKNTGFFLGETADGLVAHHITTDFVGKGASAIDQMYDSSKTDEYIEHLNMLYVANTRAKDELYNILVLPKPPGPGSKAEEPDKWMGLFEEPDTGTPLEDRKPELLEQKPTNVSLPSDIPKDFEPGDGLDSWTEERLIDARRGDFAHNVLSMIEFAEEDASEQVRRLVDQAVLSGLECPDPERAALGISRFLGLGAIKPMFAKLPGREVLRELEYVNEDGQLHRMDRVIVDDGRISIIDFKSGEGTVEIESHAGQVREYVGIMKRANPGKVISGWIAYMDGGIVREVS